MTEKKSYKDFAPFGASSGRFQLADEPVDFTKTASRRPHVQAYVAYMIQSSEMAIHQRWKKCEEKACEDCRKKNTAEVAEPWFEFMVDKMAFNYSFQAKRKANVEVPEWPWPNAQHEDLVSPGAKKSAVYARYLTMKKREELKAAIAREEAAKTAPAVDPNAMTGLTGPAVDGQSNPSQLNAQAPAFSPASTGVLPSGEQGARNTQGLQDSIYADPKIVINAETLTKALPTGGSAKQRREIVWKEYVGKMSFIRPVAYAFEMEIDQIIPSSHFLSEQELRASNSLLTATRVFFVHKTRRLIADFGQGFTPAHLGARLELLHLWNAMLEWSVQVYRKVPLKLSECICLEKTTFPRGVGDDRPATRERAEAASSAAHTGQAIQGSVKLRDDLEIELNTLVKGSIKEIDAKLQTWLSSRPSLQREACVDIAVLKWLAKCEPSERQEVLRWREMAIASLRQLAE
ncbi:hypothetical protein FSARC_13885 [Fusarium sarcochroum]|uniref:Uncharacterized protein n=1 Tax=Fusarium sarcochroum TaxID=1208366 RepID=A0A8H4SY53_9HYPO|nr:hypothetical protein FSARC_13885 [Fusarium sarcochroum]